ncbi:MAG: type III-B CRISPR module RAMP protein Cmr1, partial [Caldisphaeraceae archaeon]|nr:type III-B CRISPR module RAMP protein Cmr1 [Caldisphaeraceae archaeon]
MQGFKEIVKKANDIINKKTIFSCEFESITPWWGGGADGSTSEHVDEDEIAGRLRWFLRTVYNRFCASSDDLKSYRKSMAWVGQLLGSSVNGKSPYIIHTESRAITKINKRKAPIDNLNLSLKIILNGSVYKDAISDDEQKKYNEIISSATLLTLAYIGIGKRANRGFGRFYPKNCRYLNENNINNITKVVEEKIKEGNVEEAFSIFYDFFQENVCKNDHINSWKESSVPLAPLVNSKDNDECTINTIDCQLPIGSLLKTIEDAVAKQSFFKYYKKIS